MAIASTTAAVHKLAQASPFYNKTKRWWAHPTDWQPKLRHFTGLGVDHFVLRFADFPGTKGVKPFAREVIPLFGQA